ncbi:DUF859 family phage minor structural protein [Absicoccus intestinalis]|uniref:DUF859 family phage minor structural protein n=1 Tax=Absicoccus intestinalis TaxID=2926319 RepID=A0ABU4WR24_9FIRM|nr:DUF859 family phage minor structural protein [Absicoccus sp. CLA-KB-P134]MDX8417927.1 DUF859 family phage minor structural protein [Absicoccus sp. CLA-KB-P134]
MTLNVLESSTNTSGNYSTLSYSLVLTSTGGSAQYNGAGSYAININGSRVRSGTVNLNVGTYGSVTLASGSTTVGHNNDGSKTVSVSASYSSAASAYYLPSSGSTSGSLTLTKIPRASKIDTFTGSTVDGSFKVTYTKSVSTYTDKLRISIPNVKALMHIDYNTSGTSFTLDSTSLEYIYSNYTATQTVQLGAVLETYNGTTKIGESSEVKIDVSINCPPVISGVTLTETGLSGISSTDCVAIIGKKSVKVTATAQHHASIALIQVQNGNVTKSVSDSSTATIGFDNLSSASFVVTVTDSRGFTVSKTVTGTYYDYFRPTIQSLTVARPTDTASTATISGKGTYWNGKIGIKANTITYTITDDASVSATVPTISGTAWTISQSVSNVPYQSSFHFTVTIKDAFGQSETRQITLPSTTPVVWIGKKTVRINGVDLDQYILDKFHPIGSLYLSANNVNPGDLFGGTWVSYGEGRVLIGAGTGTDANGKQMTFTAGATGGEYSHRITIDEIPSHSHQYYSPIVQKVTAASGGSTYGNYNKQYKISTDSSGGDQAISLMGPYIVGYMWRRIG